MELQVPHSICTPIPQKGILWYKEAGDKADIEAALQLVRSNITGSRGMSGSYPHARRDTAEAFGIILYGVFERKEQYYDLQQVGEYEVQVPESFILVQRVLC